VIWRIGVNPVAPLPLVLGQEDWLSEVYVIGDALLAVGHATIDGLANALIWVSVDGGSTWGLVADRPAFEGINNEIAAIIPSPTGLLAVGRRWDPLSAHPVPEVWVAEP
jgi:photosystem II stability/assembly factor-like uncharacterized protein